MKRSIIFVGVALAIGLVASTLGHASSIEFDLSFSNALDTISGSGILYATPNPDGSYLAVAGSISVLIGDTGTFGGVFATSAPDGQSVNLDLTLSTSNVYPATVAVPNMIGSSSFTYDNLIFPSSGTQFDLDGLLFTDGTSYLNLVNLDGQPFFDTYAIYDPDSADLGNYLYYDSMTAEVTPSAPEPSTLALLGAGAGIFAWRRRTA